jgi:hypothetical protein
MRIAAHLKQPTRMINPGKRAGLAPCVIPIRSCSRWGLPCRFRCRSRGGLLPHPFTLTPPPHSGCSRSGTGNQVAGRFAFCGTFPGVAPAGRYPAPLVRGARTFLALLSFDVAGRGCPADWRALLRPPGMMARTIAAVRAPDDTSTGSTIDKSRTAAYRARRVKAPAARWLVHGEVLRIKVSSTDFS